MDQIPPQTPLGELTVLTVLRRPPSWRGGAGLGKRGKGREGKWREEKGGPQVTVEPGPSEPCYATG